MEKKLEPLINFGNSPQIFRHFVETSSAVLSNCILFVRRTFWVEKILIEGTGFCWITSRKEQKAISFLSSFSYGVVKIALSFSKRSFWVKLLSWKNQLCSTFSNDERPVSGHLAKIPYRNVKTAFYVPIGAMMIEKFSWKTYLFSSTFLDIEWKILVFCLKVLSGVVKAPVYILRRKIYFWKKWSILIKFGYSAKSFGCLWKNLRQLCHNRILPVYWNLVSRRLFLGIFFENLRHFQTVSHSFCFWFNFFTQGLHNCVASVQKNILRKIRFFEWILLFFIFLYIDWKVFALLPEIAREGCQNGLLLVYWKPVKSGFGKNNINSSSTLNIRRKTFDFLSKSSRQCCETA